MKIIHLGQELDPMQEHELISNSKFGFKINIKYTKQSWLEGKTDTAYNCTEFHWRYTDIFNTVPCNRVAFESDIHRTGFNKDINDIEYVIIELANKLYECF